MLHFHLQGEHGGMGGKRVVVWCVWGSLRRMTRRGDDDDEEDDDEEDDFQQSAQ